MNKGSVTLGNVSCPVPFIRPTRPSGRTDTASSWTVVTREPLLGFSFLCRVSRKEFNRHSSRTQTAIQGDLKRDLFTVWVQQEVSFCFIRFHTTSINFPRFLQRHLSRITLINNHKPRPFSSVLHFIYPSKKYYRGYSTQLSWWGGRGSTVEALCYKPEGCGFDSRWGTWIFQLT
jgi:hypothetical protein